MGVPQRTLFSGVAATTGNIHTLTFKHDATKGGKHAYDWLVSYPQAVALASAAGIPFTDLGGQACNASFQSPFTTAGCSAVRSGSFVDIAVPDDAFTSVHGSTQTRINDFETSKGNRTIRLYGNAAITSPSLTLSHDVANGGDTNNSEISYLLTWTSSSTEILLEFAGHLSVSGATPGYAWGAGLGAGFIKGGPYHFSLGDIDGDSVGSQDNQIKILFSASIATTPSATSVPIGGSISDSATVTGDKPTGSVTFNLFGPNDPACGGQAAYTETVNLPSGNNDAKTLSTSTFTPAVAGVYRWVATYSGDQDNAGDVSGCDEEVVTITQATPGIQTVPTPSSGTVGQTVLNDSATLSGGSSPTGTITFKLYNPNHPLCTGTPAHTETVAVGANPSVTVNGPTANLAGVWRWTATYNGNANNQPVTSGCDDEQVAIAKDSPTLVTTPSAIKASVGTTLHDSADLDDGYNPTGSITFNLFPPADQNCGGTPVFTYTVNNVNGNDTYDTFASAGFATTQAGLWHWTASYSGDDNNDPAVSDCDEEEVEILPVDPTFSTTPSPASGTVGATTLNDSANLSGGFNAGGSITFSLYDPTQPACGTPRATFGPVAVNGDGTYSTPSGFLADLVGTWRWTAVYTGDTNNKRADSGCDDEPVTIAKGQPTIQTTPAPASGTVGVTALNDSASLSGGYQPTGTITFNLYAPSDPTCAQTPAFTVDIPVGVGPSVTTTGPIANAAGTWRWTATYGGDANNFGATSGCQAEQVTIARSAPGIQTTPMPSTGTVGVTTLNDSASLSGGIAPTGTITFNLYPPSDPTCAQTPAFTVGIPVGAGPSVTTTGPIANAAGTWRWTATYGGDANNLSAGSGCQDEQVTIGKASPGLATTPSAVKVQVGTAIGDAASLTGGFNATGTITFKLYDPTDSTCAGTPRATFGPVQVSGDGIYGTGGTFDTDLAGVWRWTASYSGDQNNSAASSGCRDEEVTVDPAAPTLPTTPNPTTAIVGTVLNDSADLSGGFSSTGTITFRLYDPTQAQCTGIARYTEVVNVNGNGVYGTSPGFGSDATGTWAWTATYSGDGNNLPAASLCTDEEVTVDPAAPAIQTTQTPASGTVGVTALNDSADLSGGFNPTGTITFELFDPNDVTCSGAPVFTVGVAVTANGTYATTTGPIAGLAGTWRWTASYSGDANNLPVASGCDDELVLVGKADPAIATEPSDGVLVGSPIHDTAEVTGGNNPTGTVTFTLFGPDDPNCTGAAIFTSTVPLQVNGSATSGDFTTTEAGGYEWVAEYGGDANNNRAISACGQESIAQAEVLPRRIIRRPVAPGLPRTGTDVRFMLVAGLAFVGLGLLLVGGVLTVTTSWDAGIPSSSSRRKRQRATGRRRKHYPRIRSEP